MLRSIRFLSASLAARDFAGIGLLVLILSVIAWTLSIIFSPTMRDMAMKRFHLGADSFPLWAAHQSVPAMYNFENRVQFSNELLGDAPFDPTDKTYGKYTLNHFPARFITFGDRVPTCFSEQRQGTFEMSSTFGERELVSRWQIQQVDSEDAEKPNGQLAPMVIQRISQRWNPKPPTSQPPQAATTEESDE